MTSDPQAGRDQTASRNVADNLPGSPQTVALAGTGQDFSLTAAPTNTTVTPGQAGNYTLTVSPLNGFAQKVVFSCSGAPPQSTCTVTPGSVSLNGTASATAKPEGPWYKTLPLSRDGCRFCGQKADSGSNKIPISC